MGKVAETKRKKKRGRPSLLDLQKRSLKQQEEKRTISNNYPKFNASLNRRSTRWNPNPDVLLPASERIYGEEEDEREEKKHKFLHGLPLQHHRNSRSSANSSLNSVLCGSDLNADGEDLVALKNKRKISAVGDGSAEKGKKVLKSTDTAPGFYQSTDTPPGSLVGSCAMTPLPDKKLLVFMLDRLQKKDTRGVFSEPVDPEELPDYHDIIERPMDFGTVRMKLEERLYGSLEDFEEDVFLICTNAMEYNEPNTIYYRQAQSIQELAKKDFEILRQDSDCSEPKIKVVRRGRPPSKNLKNFLDRSCDSEFSSDAVLATSGDRATLSNSCNLDKGQTSFKLLPADAVSRASHGYAKYEISKWENEFPVSIRRGVSKYGKNDLALDENRRDTYYHPLASGHDFSHMATHEGDMTQLMAVGLHWEHGYYCRSLARFAADLGAVVWKFASHKIAQILPIEIEFRPSWMREKQMLQKQPQLPVSEKHGYVLAADDHPNQPLALPASGAEFFAVNGSLFPIIGAMSETINILNPQRDLSVLSRDNGGMRAGFAREGFLPQHKHEFQPATPDLNAVFWSHSLPTNLQIGSSAQPDLDLQL